MTRTTLNRSLLAAALALAVGTTGCGDPLGVDGGRVRFVLSSAPDAPAAVLGVDEGVTGTTPDGPSTSPSLSGEDDDDHEWKHRNPYFATANVTFTSILARNLDGVLVDVNMDLPATIDVVAMEGERGRQIALPDGDLPAGTYDQIVVVMTNVEGVTRDGTTVSITPPGGGWTSIVPICPFVVEEGATAVVGLQLSVKRSFSWRNDRFHFQPRFVCEAAPESEDEVEG